MKPCRVRQHEVSEDTMACHMQNKPRAALALALLVPAPGLGVACGMIWFPNSGLGTVLFGAAKIWLLAMPLVWLLFVDRERIGFSRMRHGGLGLGLLTGLGISAIILGFYLVLGDRLIDREFLVTRLTEIGLGVPLRYVIGATYWITINSLLEEYVWRWFCVRKCEAIMPAWAAIVASALCFTLHHIVAMQVFFPPAVVAICSTGIFIGGAIWSALYIRYRSIWPAYLSHAIVDLCVFGIGAWMLFSS